MCWRRLAAANCSCWISEWRRSGGFLKTYQYLLGDLPGLEFMPEAGYGQCNRWLTVVLIHPEEFGATSNEVRLALEAENIESRPVWKPMHLQPVFRGCRVRGGSVSEYLFQCGLCLPSGTAMTESRCRASGWGGKAVCRCSARRGEGKS